MSHPRRMWHLRRIPNRMQRPPHILNRRIPNNRIPALRIVSTNTTITRNRA
jgi:hypothetical protein